MKEQSHKDEMSAALRGDFERLRDRGVSVSLAPVPEPVEHEQPSEPVPEREHGVSEAHDARPPGWLGRLLGR